MNDAPDAACDIREVGAAAAQASNLKLTPVLF
jgi:hypothetical protein